MEVTRQVIKPSWQLGIAEVLATWTLDIGFWLVRSMQAISWLLTLRVPCSSPGLLLLSINQVFATIR